eukprot:Phypoly_transcript_23468.p1 GENE.Phypoly_transcript_23468~~Phypoly_transcript_23468.p1  ORF type:complete len:107 (+),score=9.13 Phypoly_transcript_23468:1-321(+)
MAELHVLQTGLFYQKQKPIFVGKKRLLGLKLKKSDTRYVRQVGLGYKTPKAALEGTFVDDKCPFTGNVSIRGRIHLHLFEFFLTACIIIFDFIQAFSVELLFLQER